ncbi:hypothetical protein NQ318_001191 [Aromia moschata]|uniref:Uncharacterized protein n=1 Tax=Aromia moschata TaxID=1265417 RepID=A0AAV8ZH60_9CUCU|nr:hypothetical protein NQ318_001191 [Aromia moschata]
MIVIRLCASLVLVTDLEDCLNINKRMTMLSTEAQVRYLVQWFQEWSELQRSDFLPIMAEKYANKAYVNGIINSISNVDCRDKPMSLFECRIKLFKEWFVQWNAEQKRKFSFKNYRNRCSLCR